MNDMPSKDLISPYLKALKPIRTNAQLEGGLKKPIRCLMCDIYGTLLISASGDVGQSQMTAKTARRLSGLLKRYAISMTAEQLIENLHHAIEEAHVSSREDGIEFPEVRIENIWQALMPSTSSDEIVRFAVEFEMLLNPVWPMPHLSELLTACRERGILLGIISNAQFFTPYLFELLTESSLESLGFRDALTFLSYRHGFAKPSDSLFRMAAAQLQKMGIAPCQTAYMGNDMRKDILPAQKHGFQTILFAGDARSLRTNGGEDKMGAVEPDLVVTDLHQVIPYLGNTD